MTCCICERERPENLVIMGKNICDECEDALMSARIDEPDYDEWISKIETAVLEYDVKK